MHLQAGTTPQSERIHVGSHSVKWPHMAVLCLSNTKTLQLMLTAQPFRHMQACNNHGYIFCWLECTHHGSLIDAATAARGVMAAICANAMIMVPITYRHTVHTQTIKWWGAHILPVIAAAACTVYTDYALSLLLLGFQRCSGKFSPLISPSICVPAQAQSGESTEVGP